ncbi:MAG: hypothetical protein UX71_C0002G0049 [Parcubacteria group bacterium GW2011_GWA1_47_10]|uniref:Type 4a pilus biogenesis protein PilO n=1 Tax=Candidatus Zambryskibacteria bacterium RIFCSPHIGHO2_01_FULL_46_25 TaxID=1802738 RepID=A0A1G2T0L0_9BACT|nr:MAG: hypothetical protein UX71_C0002G0049 [Parcubacteria group bacterium GW2011_GWA1_47_10]OHA90662.1 MAG: hypothetical protein A2838_03015 [Candidatus Zambryskibacteria bacterium RIFCSPHIGHO2_01_FULL_46_25]OHB07305.1 MAG: hypothetical protein A3A31_02155 [Candidatus Zambryskibacteria bacterium RIFCSPLOWO2_01_FULL_48_25]
MKNTTAIFLIILAIGLFFTFTKPYYNGLKEVAAESASYREALDNLENIIETRDRLLINYNSIPKSEIDRLSKALPENIDTVRLAHELDSIGAKYGISIKDLAVDTEANKNATNVALPGSGMPYEKALVRVSFVSDYGDFRRFLEDLEKSLRIMDIRSVKFEVPVERAQSGLYEHELTIETYWVK